jgi:hypothetical protein
LEAPDYPVTFLAIGLILFIVGLGHALLGPRQRRARAAVLGLGAAAAALTTTVLQPAAIIWVGVTVAFVILLLAAVGSQRVAIVADRLRRARFHWVTLGVLGLLLALLGVVGFGSLDGLTRFENKSPKEKIYQRWPLLAAGPVEVTDHGTVVHAEQAPSPRGPEELDALEREILSELGLSTHLIETQPPDDHSNCFGWVLTGGRYWLGETDAEAVLRENGYQTVAAPNPGDLVVYRDQGGNLMHTAVVRAVCNDGEVLVEGKWMWMGVFLHRVKDSLFGSNYTFLRSPRQGHLLTGLPEPTAH